MKFFRNPSIHSQLCGQVMFILALYKKAQIKPQPTLISFQPRKKKEITSHKYITWRIHLPNAYYIHRDHILIDLPPPSNICCARKSSDRDAGNKRCRRKEEKYKTKMHNETALFSRDLQTLNCSSQWKTCLLSRHHGNVICQGWIMLFRSVSSRLYSFCAGWVALDPLAECPAGSLIPFGVRLSSLEEPLIFPISQWGTSGRCVILGNDWSGLVYIFNDLCV